MNQYICSSHPELNPCVNDTGASSISENCSAQHKTKEMAYLCLTCSYCCIFDWQCLYVWHTYAWYLILCFFKTEEEEKSNVTVLYLFQPQQHLFVNTFFFIYCTCLQYYHCLTPRPCELCVYYIHLSSLISFCSHLPYCSIFSFDVKQFGMGYFKKSKS
jgi:hypothetical protein